MNGGERLAQKGIREMNGKVLQCDSTPPEQGPDQGKHPDGCPDPAHLEFPHIEAGEQTQCPGKLINYSSIPRSEFFHVLF